MIKRFFFDRIDAETGRAAVGGENHLPINILAHKSLLAVFGEGGALVRRRHVRLARKDTEGTRAIGWW